MQPSYLPESYIASLRELLGEETEAYLASLEEPPVESLRFHRGKWTPEEAQAKKTAEEREQKERTDVITRQLPPGCEFRDLGTYRRDYTNYPIFAIFCGQKVTTGYSMPSGKSRKQVTLTVERG